MKHKHKAIIIKQVRHSEIPPTLRELAKTLGCSISYASGCVEELLEEGHLRRPLRGFHYRNLALGRRQVMGRELFSIRDILPPAAKGCPLCSAKHVRLVKLEAALKDLGFPDHTHAHPLCVLKERKRQETNKLKRGLR